MEEKGLKIVKARVEQDNYEASELRIIKKDDVKILKDLYIEKEFNDGEFYSVSDNVLVSLHRTLREGETANLALLSQNGDMLTSNIFESIEMYGNIAVCVKAVSDRPSVLQNIALKDDNLKVEELNKNSVNIKTQIMNASKVSNGADLTFVLESPYKDAIVYVINKDEEGYKVEVVAEDASFVAIDSNNIYSHTDSNLDLVKIYNKEDKTEVEENKEEIKEEVNNVVPEIPSIERDVTEITNEIASDDTTDEGEVEGGRNIHDEIKEEKPEEKVEEKKEVKHTLDDGNYDTEEEFDQLSDMILKLVEQQKASLEKINTYEQEISELETKVSAYEEQVSDLSENLEKAEKEVDSKTKKVNTLINENRRYIDENNELKGIKETLEKENKNLLDENNKYLKENNTLKEEAIKGKTRISEVISSIDEVLTSYSKSDEKVYTKKN